MKNRSIFARRTLGLLLAIALILTSGISGFATERVTYDDYEVEEANYFDDLIFDTDPDEALDAIIAERENEGMVGFEGEFALPEYEGEIVSVFVMFDSSPAAIQVIEAEQRGDRSLDVEDAREVVEAEHEAFWDELEASDIPFGDYLEYTLAINAVQLEVPAGRVAELAAMDSVRAVYPFMDADRELPEVEPVLEAPRDEETNDPRGNAEGRAIMRANEMHARGFTGEGIVVAIVDGGVDTRHPATWGTFITFEEQYNRMAPEHRPLLTEDNNIGGNFYGRWFNGTAVTPEPRNWGGNHGTHVTGTVLGRDTGHPTQAILGVAPGAINFHYRVGNRIAAVEWVLRDAADMATMSMGHNNANTPVLLENIAYNTVLLTDPMFVWVNAMNNTGPFYYTGDTPDNSPMVLACANAWIHDFFNDERPTVVGTNTSSGRGPVAVAHTIRPDITAHGTLVLSSNALGTAAAVGGAPPAGSTTAEAIARIPETATDAQREPLGRSTGTSMATPHVAGAVALLMEYDIYLHGERTWTRAEIKSRLMHNATEFYTPYQTAFSTGGGFVDVIRAADAQTAVTVNYDRVPTRGHASPINVNTQANYNSISTLYWSHLNPAEGESGFATGRVASFSFGGSNQPVADPLSRTLTGFIRNFAEVDRTYTIAAEFRHNAGEAGRIEFSTATLTVPAGAELPFDATFRIDADRAVRGFYEGRVVVTAADGETLRIPFAFTYDPVTIFTLGGGGTPAGAQPRPALPVPITITEVGRPVISTNATNHVNRASGMLPLNFEHWAAFAGTLRITDDEGANAIANLSQFNMQFTPHVPFNLLPGSVSNRMSPLDRSAQDLTALTEGAYDLHFLTGNTNQANLPTIGWVSTPFFVDNTAPELEFDVEVAPNGNITISGTVYDEWATWAAENDVTFPGNEAFDLPVVPDQSFNAVWISLDGRPSIRADVDAEGAFEVVVHRPVSNRPLAITVWAIDNYTLIPDVEIFRTGGTSGLPANPGMGNVNSNNPEVGNTRLDFGAVARDYFLPGGLMGGFVRDEDFPGYVWSGLNMTERAVVRLPNGEIVEEWFGFILPATIRRNQTVTPELILPAGLEASDVRWTSSNPALARVNATTGAVTAVQASGIVTITAISSCGEFRYSVPVRLSA